MDGSDNYNHIIYQYYIITTVSTQYLYKSLNERRFMHINYTIGTVNANVYLTSAPELLQYHCETVFEGLAINQLI